MPTKPNTHNKYARISDCDRYRYLLTRSWPNDPEIPIGYMLPVVMLNPSTADAYADDPTIRRVIQFARREQFSGIRVVNLFAFRATYPGELYQAMDPVGKENPDYIEQALDYAQCRDIPVLVGWGAQPVATEQAKAFFKQAKAKGTKLVCLGTTKDGSPRHPLYVKADTPFQPWECPTGSSRSSRSSSSFW